MKIAYDLEVHSEEQKTSGDTLTYLFSTKLIRFSAMMHLKMSHHEACALPFLL